MKEKMIKPIRERDRMTKEEEEALKSIFRKIEKHHPEAFDFMRAVEAKIENTWNDVKPYRLSEKDIAQMAKGAIFIIDIDGIYLSEPTFEIFIDCLVETLLEAIKQSKQEAMDEIVEHINEAIGSKLLKRCSNCNKWNPANIEICKGCGISLIDDEE